MDDLSTRIVSVANKSFEVETEEGRAKQHSLDSLLKVQQYRDSVTAGAATTIQTMGRRTFRQKPPGMTGPRS